MRNSCFSIIYGMACGNVNLNPENANTSLYPTCQSAIHTFWLNYSWQSIYSSFPERAEWLTMKGASQKGVKNRFNDHKKIHKAEKHSLHNLLTG